MIQIAGAMNTKAASATNTHSPLHDMNDWRNSGGATKYVNTVDAMAKQQASRNEAAISQNPTMLNCRFLFFQGPEGGHIKIPCIPIVPNTSSTNLIIPNVGLSISLVVLGLSKSKSI
jgi:hypothetical protein